MHELKVFMQGRLCSSKYRKHGAGFQKHLPTIVSFSFGGVWGRLSFYVI